MAGLILSCSPKRMPDKWSRLGIPTEGIVEIRNDTGVDGLFIDYSFDISRDTLFKQVDSLLKAAGYTPSCNILDGYVLGYSNADENLVMKVDNLFGVNSLSIFNENVGDKMLYGLCFKGYILGEEEQLNAHEFDSLLQRE
jgi:hypothetical protein